MATENKDFEYYAGLPYETVIVRDEDGWFAKVKDLPGCMTWTDTFEELGPLIEDAKRSWIGEALEHGDPVPEPRTTEGYSGKVNLRMPKSLHRDLVRQAQSEGVSLNQLMISYLSREVGSASRSASTPYDALSIEEVKRRLESLSHEELNAVKAYEAKRQSANREEQK